jgi:uncharacterized protein (TIGR03435 family)
MLVNVFLMIAILTASTATQSSSSAPQELPYDVVSIRPLEGDGMLTVHADPGRFVGDVTVQMLLISAYRVSPQAIRNAPGWVRSERFHIEVTLPSSARSGKPPSQAELSTVLRAILASRFDLVVREMSVDEDAFRLVRDRADGRLGPQLRRSTLRCEGDKSNYDAIRKQNGGSRTDTESECRLYSPEAGSLTAKGISVLRLAQYLSSRLGVTIVDASGLQDRYDFDLTWQPEGPEARDGLAIQSLGDRPGIFSAIRDQLGLRLEPAKSGHGAIIVDHIARPSAN